MFLKFADDAIKGNWTDELISKKTESDIAPVLSRIAFHQIDTESIIKSQVNYTIALTQDKNASFDEVLDSSMMIALSLLRQSNNRQGILHQMKKMTELMTMLATNEEKDIPDSLFLKIEEEMNATVSPVLQLLQDYARKGRIGSLLSPTEILATFQLANADTLRHSLKSIGQSYQDELRRKKCDFYPRDGLPPTVAKYLSKIVMDASKHIQDDRAEQLCLGMLVSLGGCSSNLEQMQDAVSKSLSLTQGKVTELSPYPIPEALAAFYQENGDMDKALKYFKLALEGIRTFVYRQKCDAIVLNACLVQAQMDIKQALKMAFEYSPFFSESQQHGIIGSGRGLLLKQCDAWSTQLGFDTINVAKDSLMTQEDDESHDEGSNVGGVNGAGITIPIQSSTETVVIVEKETASIQMQTGSNFCGNCMLL